jgi:poly(3-hydroxybutyrate) depolymerase
MQLAMAAAVLSLVAPAGWFNAAHGPAGGTIWEGRIPNTFVPADTRLSAIYLPPGYSPARRYPVVYLLHGMRGSPSSIFDAMRLPDAADRLIASGAPPFIAVMPVAGPTVHPNRGEWAGVWEDYLVRDVVPWVDQNLPTIATAHGRALEGLCAGGFGAIDIGLRHQGIFGTLGSFEGYFAPVFHDGPFAAATTANLRAHDPSILLRRDAVALRRGGVRFYISAGGNHGHIRQSWSLAFAHELGTLRLTHELWLLPFAESGHFWRSTLPSALAYAAAGFATRSSAPA